jgi:hypothetical protein
MSIPSQMSTLPTEVLAAEEGDAADVAVLDAVEPAAVARPAA